MLITTATAVVNELGPLRKIVNAFGDARDRVMEGDIKSTADWLPIAQYVAIDEFKRVGAYLEELDFDDYCRFLTGWAAGGTRFEMTEFHVNEIGNAVFQEIEERHYRGDRFIRKNVIAVWRFNADNKINRLDIYEQAQDSGDWIIDAARNATT